MYDDDIVHIQRNWESVKNQHFRGLLVELIASYEQLYEKSFPEGYSKQRRSEIKNDANRILLWVLGAKTQLGWKEYYALYPDGNALAGPVSKICQNFLHISEYAMIAASHSSVWDYVSLKTTGQVENFIQFAEGDEKEERRSASILEDAKESAASLAQKQIAEDCLKLIADSDDAAFSVDEETQSSLLQYACCNWSKHVDTLVGEDGVPPELRNQVRAMFDSRYITRWISAYDSHSSYTTALPDPLYYATLLGYVDIVKLLMVSGPIPRTGGRFGQALQLAAFQGKTTIVHELLQEGFDINQADNVLGTPLQAAIAGRHHDLANTLMDDYGANVHATGATFGSALQMALALRDPGLATSLRNHGAVCEKTNRVNRVWDKAWVLTQTSRININKAIRILRTSELFAHRELPEGLDNHLEVLALCIHLRQEIDEYIQRVEIAKRLHQGEKAQTKNVNEEEFWQMARKRLQHTEMGATGFLPATFTWILLADYHFTMYENSAWPDVFDTIFKILCEHEMFITTFPENVPDLELEESLPNLFAHLMVMVYRLNTQYYYDSRTRSTRFRRFGIEQEDGMKSNLQNDLGELQVLHKTALTTENNAKTLAALYQVLSGYNDSTTSKLEEMKQEIADLKEDINVLNKKIDSLLSFSKT